MNSRSSWWSGSCTCLYLQLVLFVLHVPYWSADTCWYQYTPGNFYSIWMGVQFLIFFGIQKDMVNLFDVRMISIYINGENDFILRWARRKRQRHIYIWWSNTPLNVVPIQGYDLRLCLSSFYQIHPTSINKTDGRPSSEEGDTNKVSETT